MTLNPVFGVCLVCFIFFVELILASRNFDLNVRPDLEDLISGDSDTNFYSHSSDTSRSKRTRTTTSSPSKESKTPSSKNLKYKNLKYSVNTHPIKPVITETLANTLKCWERILLNKGYDCVWENFDRLTVHEVKTLCTQIWNIELQEISEIKVKHGRSLDCDARLIFGPSDPDRNSRFYNGIFQYTESFEDFSPDLVRCNCAVVRKYQSKFIAEDHSKRFFFLFKHSNAMYYVLTTLGTSTSRQLRIVNVRSI